MIKLLREERVYEIDDQGDGDCPTRFRIVRHENASEWMLGGGILDQLTASQMQKVLEVLGALNPKESESE